MKAFWLDPWAFVFLPVLVTAIAYSGLGKNDFVNWDDGVTITDNFPIRSFDLKSLQWMLTSTGEGYWVPLTWVSLGLDYHLGGLDPWIYHWDNLFLHLLNVTLVFLLSQRLLSLVPDPLRGGGAGGRPGNWALSASLLTAVLFGIHPVHVESVAWASERKEVLCGVFYLSCLLAYLGYAADPKKGRWKLFCSMGFLWLSVLSKPMAISLPFILLLLDAWPLGRFGPGWKAVLLEKIPFLAPVVISGWLALFSQIKVGAVPILQKLPLDFRMMNAFHSATFYLLKLAWPFGYSCFYPLDITAGAFSPGNILALLAVFLVSLAVLYSIKTRPYLAVGWGFYLVTLAPVSGIVQVGAHAEADRYAYLSTLGPILLFSALLSALLQKRKSAFVVFSAGLCLFLGYRTFQQVAVWQNSTTLWENAVKLEPGSEVGYWYLGFAYRDSQRPEEALAAFERSIAINPRLSVTHYGKGLALSDLGRIGEAVEEYQQSILLDPQYAQPHINLSVDYQRLGRYDEAVAEGETAIRLDSQSGQAYNNLGVCYGYKGRISDAVTAFQQAVRLEPGNGTYQANWAAALQMLGNNH